MTFRYNDIFNFLGLTFSILIFRVIIRYFELSFQLNQNVKCWFVCFGL